MKDITRKVRSAPPAEVVPEQSVEAAPGDCADRFAEEKKRYALELERQNDTLRDTERAVLNILEDTSALQEKAEGEAGELRKFRAAVENSPIHTVITDPDGIVLYANDAVETTTGFSPKEIYGQTPRLWGRQMDREFYERLWKTIKIDKKSFAGEIVNKRKNGEQYIVEGGIFPLLGEDGQVEFFVGIERDVTEERRYQDELVASAKQLEESNAEVTREKERAEGVLRFLRSIGDGVFATDRDGKIVFMNKAAEELSGCPIDTAEGIYYGDVFCFSLERDPRAGCVRMVEDAVTENRSGDDGLSRVILGRRDGRQIPVSYAVSPIRDEGGMPIGCVVTIQDASRDRQMERMKNDFLSIAAHQLRTPLTGMRWSLEMLLESDGLSDEVAAEIRKIHDNSCRMSVLIDDLIDASRINQRFLSEKPVFTDPSAVILAAVGSMRPAGEKRRIAIVSHLPADMPEVPIIEEGFREVMTNLIGNAIRYSRDGGEVRVDAVRRGNVLRVSVADRGIGIPSSEQGRIFTQFFRATNAMLKEADGSGIGLSSVKTFLDTIGGRIWFESAEGEGTTFHIELPIVPERKAAKKK